MRSRKFLLGLVLVALACAAVWLGWHWYTTPAAPSIPLDGVHPAVVEAVEKAIQRIHREPRSGKAWGELGQVLIANGMNERALPCLIQAEVLDPSQPCWPYLHGSVALLLSKPREGIPKLRHALTLTSGAEERLAIHFLLVQALVEEGQLEEAEQHLQALRDNGGDPAQVHFGLGILALARDNRPEAQKHLVLLANHPCARRLVASLLAGLTQGDEKLAARYREQVLTLPQDNAWPCSFDDDVRQFRVNTSQMLDRYNELVAAGHRTEALEFLRDSVRRDPEEMTCYMLGAALVGIEEFEEAEKALRQAIDINPRTSKTHVLLGVAQLERGDKLLRAGGGKEQAEALLGQAVLAADKALSLQGDHAVAHFVRGRALKSLGRIPEALAALRQATLVGPDLAEMHQALGETLAEAGNLREGLEHLENAVRVAPPTDPRPRQTLEKWQAKVKTLP